MAEEIVKNIILVFVYEKLHKKKNTPKSVKVYISKIGSHSLLSWSKVGLEAKFHDFWWLRKSWTRLIWCRSVYTKKNAKNAHRIRKNEKTTQPGQNDALSQNFMKLGLLVAEKNDSCFISIHMLSSKPKTNPWLSWMEILQKV